ncbi:MAG: hypothetical protein LBC39_05890 [Methanobrevibacter sp.]|jgi:hypothetical protein|nr:hypothetical protein [Candidatus Methanovirga aequatorialis]
MITISKREDIIYRQVKTLSLEYENRIPINILNMELEIYKEYLKDALNDLNNKGIITHENNIVRLNRLDEEMVVEDETMRINEMAIENEEINDVHDDNPSIEDDGTGGFDKKETEDLELNEKEGKSLRVIGDLVKDDKTVSRYLLEGNLLYGELKLSNFSMYHVLLSLENNNLIRMIKKIDGDYYKLLI